MNIVEYVKNLPKQELMAYLAILAGVVLIILAILLW